MTDGAEARAALPMAPPSCELDAAALRQQLDRYAAIGDGAHLLRVGPTLLHARLGDRVSRMLVETTIATERGCCPIFELTFDPEARMLRVTVPDPADATALDAIERALAASGSSPPRLP